MGDIYENENSRPAPNTFKLVEPISYNVNCDTSEFEPYLITIPTQQLTIIEHVQVWYSYNYSKSCLANTWEWDRRFTSQGPVSSSWRVGNQLAITPSYPLKFRTKSEPTCLALVNLHCNRTLQLGFFSVDGYHDAPTFVSYTAATQFIILIKYILMLTTPCVCVCIYKSNY